MWIINLYTYNFYLLFFRARFKEGKDKNVPNTETVLMKMPHNTKVLFISLI
jgi:hypothetical protein